MWGVAEWQAVVEGAVRLERPGLFATGLAAVAVIGLFALARGPWRIRVPHTREAVRWRWLGALQRASLEPAWLLSLALRGAALLLVATTLAGPVGLVPENPAGGEGIDLLIALDASGSMRALDAHLDDNRATRLALAKRVVADFVKQRGGDRIGLVVFGEHAFTQCPLTVDHRLVLESLERTEIGVAGDATALGEAIGLATRRLRVRGAPPDARRILMLITDGRHNSGQLAPETAAHVAALSGVKIHAIGIGTTGRVPFAQDSPGRPLRFERVDLDQKTLESVASISGGDFFHAEQPEDLRRVTDAIDRLEARPQAAEPRVRRASLAPFTLALALVLLWLEAATAHGLLRRLP
jgi:Ca-activated chloride channel family protein